MLINEPYFKFFPLFLILSFQV